MSKGRSGKVCVMCGESCLDRPRVKDPKGRYFCRPCYEKAITRKRLMGQDDEPETPRGNTPPRGSGTLSADDWGTSLTAGLDDDAPDLADASAGPKSRSVDAAAETPASTGGVCPNCGADFPLAAVICINCGYNTTTGHTVEAKFGGTVIAKKDVPTNTVWPSVFGILAIVFSVGFAGMFVWGLVEVLLSRGELAAELEGVEIGPTSAVLGSSVLALPLIALMGWHGMAGIGLLQRRAWGYRQILLWAKVLIGIVALLWVVSAGILSLFLATAGGVTELLVLLGFSAVAAGGFLAWPIFVLIWLSRDRITEEVDEWE